MLSLLTLAVVAAPAQGDLSADLAAILNHPSLRGATVGVYVKELGGDEVFARQPDRRLVPASVMKLVTAAAAWHKLGPDFRPKTRVWRDAVGVKLVGGGDPGLTIDELDALGYTMQIQPGEAVFFDDGLFGPQMHAPSWDPKDFVYGYCAPITALTVNRGRVELWAEAGRAWLEPRNFGISVSGTPARGNGGASFTRGSDGWRVTVRGSANSPTRVSSLSLPDPGHCAARVFHPRATRSPGLEPPENAEVFAPRSLADLVPWMLIESDNHYAENLFRLMGVKKGASGSWQDSAMTVNRFMSGTLGAPAGSYSIADGSGLSRSNGLTPRTIVRLLEWMLAHEDADTMLGAMATPGNGTLKTRLVGSEGVWAKTGTLTGASGLAGVIEVPLSLDPSTGRAKPKRYVFAILMNGYSRSAVGPRSVQDAFVMRLARLRALGSPHASSR